MISLDAGEPKAPATPPGRTRWEAWSWLLAGWLLAAVLTWPLIRHVRSGVPKSLSDPLSEAWSVAWGGHAALSQPLRLFDGNVGWPAGPSLAFTDSLLGYLPAALVGSGPTAAVVRYNMLFLFTYALCFAAAALLARELGCSPLAAAVAGAAYAYAPARLGQLDHLNVLSTGGVPLTLFLLLSGYRRRRSWQVLAGWGVAAWQVSLGFALGIWFCYLMMAVVGISFMCWLRAGRPRIGRRLLLATAGGGVAFLLVVVALAQPYLAVIRNDPGATRSAYEVTAFSPPPRGFLTVAEDGRAWAGPTSVTRESLRWAPEMALFPGVLAVLLALVGLTWSPAPWRRRAGLAAATLVLAALSMGLAFRNGLLYRPLYEHLPGWSNIRTPGRLSFLWTLTLALLAAGGAQRLADAISSRVDARRSSQLTTRRWWAHAVVGLLLLGVIYEGAPRVPVVAVPNAPAALLGLRAPVVHLPSDPFVDSRFMLWSTTDFGRIGNDNASYIPTPLRQIRALKTFPDAASVRFLRTLGYRTVVLHRGLAAGTAWAHAADRPVAGLGIGRRDVDGLIIFELRP